VLDRADSASVKAASVVTFVDSEDARVPHSPVSPTGKGKGVAPLSSFEISPLFASPMRPDDFNLRSSDGHDFYVSRTILSIASPSFTSTDPGTSADATIIALAEPACIIDVLLTLIYPVEAPTWTSLDGFSAVLDAALKYDMRGAVETLRRSLVCPRRVSERILPSFVELDPLRVFAIAKMAGLDAEADLAAQATVKYYPSLTKTGGMMISPEVENMPTKHYRELMALREQRNDWKHGFVKALKGMGNGQQPSGHVDASVDGHGESTVPNRKTSRMPRRPKLPTAMFSKQTLV
jgi:hypothetical protein